MLSSIINSEIAIQTSIKIINAFVEMRHIVAPISTVLSRLENLELRQIKERYENNKKFDSIFEALDKNPKTTQGVFFDGQIWDAHVFITNLISKNSYTIVLIDNYVDITTLDMLAKKQPNVCVKIVTSPKGNILKKSDIKKFNSQYPSVTVKTSTVFHDRFLILDNKELYLIGASLKDLGKKCFGFTKMDASLIPEFLKKI